MSTFEQSDDEVIFIFGICWLVVLIAVAIYNHREEKLLQEKLEKTTEITKIEEIETPNNETKKPTETKDQIINSIKLYYNFSEKDLTRSRIRLYD